MNARRAGLWLGAIVLVMVVSGCVSESPSATAPVETATATTEFLEETCRIEGMVVDEQVQDRGPRMDLWSLVLSLGSSRTYSYRLSVETDEGELYELRYSGSRTSALSLAERFEDGQRVSFDTDCDPNDRSIPIGRWTRLTILEPADN